MFGTIGPAPGPSQPAARDPDALAVGDAVIVLAGRNARARAEVVELRSLPTPSGSDVGVIRIRRPRGGESWELIANVRRLT